MGDQLSNIAFQRPVVCSSDRVYAQGCYAVDGKRDTYWEPLAADRKQHNRVWLTVELDGVTSCNQVVMQLRSGYISGYTILSSIDGVQWAVACRKQTAQSGIGETEKAVFPRVQARFVKIEFEIYDTDRDFQLVELAAIDDVALPSGPLLERLVMTDEAGRAYQPDDTLSMLAGGKTTLTVRGVLTNGEEADLSQAHVTVACTNPEIAEMQGNLILRAHQEGIAQLRAVATLQGVVVEHRFFLDVQDRSLRPADVWLTHPKLVMEIGHPALLSAGSDFPVLHIRAEQHVTVKTEMINLSSGCILADLQERIVERHSTYSMIYPGKVAEPGLYQIRVILTTPAGISRDNFYFTVQEQNLVAKGYSRIVYPDASGKLAYVPDYKGNRVLDFSNSGYGGGGVGLPLVAPAVEIEPIAGDNTAYIQGAIDRVAALPLSADGFRGAVLLKRGTYPVSGSLLLSASGIVLRGEGAGEEGTLLCATGTAQRDVIEVRGIGEARLLAETMTRVTDLYVPVGTRTLHLEDTGCFQVGDTVKVLRYGNERWIHAIGMDAMRQRPVAGGTKPWEPFELSFERVITAIQGQAITVDAPIACAIESIWGGGAVVKVQDSGRIEQVGVECMRVDVEFDASVTDSRIDGNEAEETYLADERHAINLISMDHIQNGWVRDVVGFHLQHALVQVGRNSKWITIQDCAVYDFVSIITGGRRYAYHLMGELTLVMRAYSERARHAFAVDSRVAGPNVFLHCESHADYNTSEPHHRWSVGCLYDNVKGRIHIQDRGYLGSGQGWAGANYVTWNTRQELVSQQPPTAQNYAIGHVGAKGKALFPNAYDDRPRREAFWDRCGAHVSPRSLYIQQLQDRLGAGVERFLQQDTRLVEGGSTHEAAH
ncbi:discoidin domain-containing protein [Paenibacillus whitsoniae]|uniref:Discoidin domain-containing protein n=1 Tax=Paenibacillus whitsoniae TaxID=2496558 RepID=A0A3S0CF15_9BACL|nr:discoidin domain-containing protein [Paenibacillus whitsoniae]RTE11239.1 discoidin domain-containing protein [Paenibacillus whitsoniae]